MASKVTMLALGGKMFVVDKIAAIGKGLYEQQNGDWGAVVVTTDGAEIPLHPEKNVYHGLDMYGPACEALRNALGGSEPTEVK